MRNKNAQNNIDSCREELKRLETLLQRLGHTSPAIQYFTKYSIIRTCGTIELCFKTIIADSHFGSPQVRNYIDKTIRDSSMNPTIDKIAETLKKFDEDWNKSFRTKIKNHNQVKRIRDSNQSLVSARNTFAHGGHPSSSFTNVWNYFNDNVLIIEMLDEVVNE